MSRTYTPPEGSTAKPTTAQKRQKLQKRTGRARARLREAGGTGSEALPEYTRPWRQQPARQELDRSLQNSQALWERGKHAIPCGTQTLSKAPSQFVYGVYPIYLVSGSGSCVFDVDGNRYIDYPMGLGAVLLGHAYPAVVEAVCTQSAKGSIFSLMHPLEVELAECLCEVIPCAEMVRFAKNGSDATAAAVRLARAVTGREKIAYCGYHGWHDWYAVKTPMAAGIPGAFKDLAIPFQYNCIESLEAVFRANHQEVAAVIFEQGAEEPKDGFLERLVETAHREGALVIWDEIVTGLRYALGGAQEYYGVTPDLACFGKGLSNGFPLSAVVGRRDLMKEFDRVFVSMTFGGETVSLAAALATVGEVRSRDVTRYLWQLGEYWRKSFNQLASTSRVAVSCIGAGPRTSFSFAATGGYAANEIRSLFLQECVKRGVLFGVPIFISFSHSPQDIEFTLQVTAEAIELVDRALVSGDLHQCMEGEMAGEVFRPSS